MGLESAYYIDGLTVTWPTATDVKSQGDDHLRLIKTVLKQTFPSANRPFYFPFSEAASANLNLDITDQNNMILLSTGGGNVTITLPVLSSGDKGWSVEVVKTTDDANSGLIYPASGQISSRCGNTDFIRVGCLYEPARFTWNGAFWMAFKTGMIGSVVSYDAASVPVGWLECDGTAISAASNPELVALIGTTLPDRRGRIDVGVDAASVHLSATHWGTAPVLGSTKTGDGGRTLLTANLPAYTPSGTVSITDPGHSHGGVPLASSSSNPDAGFNLVNGETNTDPATTGITATFTGVAQGGTSTPFSLMPPGLAAHRIIKAC